MEEKVKSAKRISVLALIISIIALLLNLYVFYMFWSGQWPKQGGEEQPVVEQVQPAEQAEPQQAEEEVVQEEAPQVPADQPVKKKSSGAAFVDLGLPSGILWRSANEEGLFTYADAVETFSKQLPTYKQYTELYENCKWQELKNGGYKVTGPNGNSIIFPLTGYINCTGEFRGEKDLGDYWTATEKKGTEDAYRVAMNANGVKILLHTKCYQRAIRLVQK